MACRTPALADGGTANAKGWTGPKEVDGKKTEGSWRSHQVPFSDMTKEHIVMLDKWMRSYRPQELFDDSGHPRFEIKALAPRGAQRSKRQLQHGSKPDM